MTTVTNKTPAQIRGDAGSIIVNTLHRLPVKCSDHTKAGRELDRLRRMEAAVNILRDLEEAGFEVSMKRIISTPRSNSEVYKELVGGRGLKAGEADLSDSPHGGNDNA